MRFRVALVFLAGLLLVAACGSRGTEPPPGGDTSVRLAPASALPRELRGLSPDIQDAYRFALANRDVLTKIPCYCGCGAVGHMDNYMCYVRSESASGRVVFDSHGAG